MKTKTFWLERELTPLGEMLLLTDEREHLHALDWSDCEVRMHRLLRLHYRDARIELRARSSRSTPLLALREYFMGRVHAIDSLLAAPGGTDFQREVWSALRTIPCGETRSYGALAAHIGKPRAVRAVGHANGQNPIGLVLPCHRVLGTNGTLTGYAGGLERKHWLLEHERKWTTPAGDSLR